MLSALKRSTRSAMHWDIGLPIICCKSRNLMSKSLVGCIFNFGLGASTAEVECGADFERGCRGDSLCNRCVNLCLASVLLARWIAIRSEMAFSLSCKATSSLSETLILFCSASRRAFLASCLLTVWSHNAGLEPNFGVQHLYSRLDYPLVLLL